MKVKAEGGQLREEDVRPAPEVCPGTFGAEGSVRKAELTVGFSL